MRLKKATLSVVIGISYVFALRVIGTFFPTIFTHPSITKVTGIISLLASLAMVVFFIYLYKDYLRQEQTKLRAVTILVVLVSLVGLLTQIRDLSITFKVNVLPYSVMIHHYIETIVPLFGAIFILIFFVVFYQEISGKELVKLKKATFLAIIAAFARTSLQAFVLFNYFYYLQFGYPTDLANNKTIIFSLSIPIILFWFWGILIFFISFYRAQKQYENCPLTLGQSGKADPNQPIGLNKSGINPQTS